MELTTSRWGLLRPGKEGVIPSMDPAARGQDQEWTTLVVQAGVLLVWGVSSLYHSHTAHWA